MAVKSSGELSMLNDIVAEFGGTAPHAMSEYYGGAGLVPAGANPNVPANGQIRFNNMYGSIAATVLTITSNTNNYNIATEAVAAGGDLNTPVLLTINSGVTVGSTSTSTPAMTTGTGWGSGTTINITNNGSIVGASGSNVYLTSSETGSGGRGGHASPYPNPQSGLAGTGGSVSTANSASNGGDAFYHAQTGSELSVIFDVTGTRSGGSAGTTYAQGGGGGGSMGANGRYTGPFYTAYRWGGAGGGGAGTPAGGGGSNFFGGSSGQSGSATSGGGGAGGTPSDRPGGGGGSGGGLGQAGGGPNPGAAGSESSVSGSAGSATAGNTGQIS